jgi:hypothetical protein
MMSDDMPELEQQKNETTAWLLASLQQGSTQAIEELEARVAQFKAENPKSTYWVDHMMDLAIARAQRVPLLVTALYHLDTKEPEKDEDPEPVIIEGEVIERHPDDSGDMEVTQ